MAEDRTYSNEGKHQTKDHRKKTPPASAGNRSITFKPDEPEYLLNCQTKRPKCSDDIHETEVTQRKAAVTALTLLNDKIIRQAFARGMTLIDSRLICIENADFSRKSPIEPSAKGGAKIAQAISKFARSETPKSVVFTDQ